MDEQRLIATIAKHLGPQANLADDAHWDPERRLVTTTDMLVGEYHFSQRYFSPQDIGWKAIAVNASDLAATGATPLHYVVGLGLPDAKDMATIEAIYEGMTEATLALGGAIVGGDTVYSPTLTLCVTAIGTVPAGATPGHRYNAQPGDWVATTGPHGLSNLGLRAFQQGLAGYPIAQRLHRRPPARIGEGQWLSSNLNRYGLMDTSDGLADAALKMAFASGVRLVMEHHRLPGHSELTQYAGGQPALLREMMLYGGEDFELLAAVPPETDLPNQWHVIGRVEAGAPGAVLVDDTGAIIEPLTLSKTFQHFAETPAL